MSGNNSRRYQKARSGDHEWQQFELTFDLIPEEKAKWYCWKWAKPTRLTGLPGQDGPSHLGFSTEGTTEEGDG
jgi:hypothetical protein